MRALLLALAACAGASSPEVVLRAGPARAHLIELFSSEGCSSCPPADAWFSSLRRHPRLWKDFVPVAFQVTYWDYLGWKDPLADPAFTARQRAYARAWGAESVYTPGFALDGEEWRRGEPPGAGETAGTLEARVVSGRVRVRYSPATPGAAFDAYAACLGFDVASSVAAGENSGRTLRHDFAALGLARANMKESGGAWTAELPLPSASVRGATRDGLAVWIAGRDGRPVQAAGGFLPLSPASSR